MRDVTARPVPVAWRGYVQTSTLGSEAPWLAALVALAAAFYLLPWAPLYLAALLGVAVIAMGRPASALLLVPLFAPYYMQPKHLGAERFAPSEIFLLVAFLAAVAPTSPVWREGRASFLRLRRSPFFGPLVLFVVAGAASTVVAADRHQAVQYFRLVVAEPALYFGLLIVVARRDRDWWLLMASVIAAGVIVGVVGLVQYATHEGLSQVPGSTAVRVRSVYGSPDNVGLLYDRLIPLWLTAFLLPIMRGVYRVALGLIGAVLLVTLYLTSSRGAWAAVAIGCLALLALRFPWGKWLVLVGVVLALLVVGVKGHSIQRALSSGHSGTVSQRLNIWQSSLAMVRAKPIFGVGPDNFIHYYAPRPPVKYLPCAPGLGYIRQTPAALKEPCLSHPHNEFLDFYLSTGLLGLAAFIWVEVMFWLAATRLWISMRPGPNRFLLLGVASAMLAALIHGLVDNSYFLDDLSILFWLLVGYVSFQMACLQNATNIAGEAQGGGAV